jgi:HEPN domain-containing protein
LKGFLVRHGLSVEHTHDLGRLLARCSEMAPSLSRRARGCALLNGHAVFTRYPGDAFDPGEADGLEMRKIALSVKDAILRCLGETDAGRA